MAKREPLIQLKYRRSPWRVLVACVLLNRTRGTVAKPVIEELFRRWPTAKSLSEADTDELTELLSCLGLQHQRALSLKYMSRAYHHRRNPRRRMTRGQVMQLAGVGKYAADAYCMLCLGDLTVKPADKELARWLGWAVENPPPWATKVPLAAVSQSAKYIMLQDGIIINGVDLSDYVRYDLQPIVFQFNHSFARFTEQARKAAAASLRLSSTFKYDPTLATLTDAGLT